MRPSWDATFRSPQPTIHRYLNLLETSYLLVRLPAVARQPDEAAHQSAQAVLREYGLALRLGGAGEPVGAHLENLVLGDLLAWRDDRLKRAEVLYWRTSLGEEVNFVIETGGKVLPVSIKATNRPRLRDAAHLRFFRAEYGRMARAALLLHTGKTLEWLTPDVLAAPWWKLL